MFHCFIAVVSAVNEPNLNENVHSDHPNYKFGVGGFENVEAAFSCFLLSKSMSTDVVASENNVSFASTSADDGCGALISKPDSSREIDFAIAEDSNLPFDMSLNTSVNETEANPSEVMLEDNSEVIIEDTNSISLFPCQGSVDGESEFDSNSSNFLILDDNRTQHLKNFEVIRDVQYPCSESNSVGFDDGKSCDGNQINYVHFDNLSYKFDEQPRSKHIDATNFDEGSIIDTLNSNSVDHSSKNEEENSLINNQCVIFEQSSAQPLTTFSDPCDFEVSTTILGRKIPLVRIDKAKPLQPDSQIFRICDSGKNITIPESKSDFCPRNCEDSLSISEQTCDAGIICGNNSLEESACGKSSDRIGADNLEDPVSQAISIETSTNSSRELICD